MYIVLEYLMYLALVTVLGAVAFALTAAAVITQEGAKRVAQSSRKLAGQAVELAEKHLPTFAAAHSQNAEQSH
jgi:hypothetical protein